MQGFLWKGRIKRAAAGALPCILALFLGGCGAVALGNGEQSGVVILSEEDILGQSAADGGSGQLRTIKETAAADAQAESGEELSEEETFLEEGSGYAKENLSPAQQIWYEDIERILGGFQRDAQLSKAGLEAGLTEEDIDPVFQSVLNDHPEIFYVDGYSYMKYYRFGKSSEISAVEFSGQYSMDRESALQRREEIREAADRILSGIGPEAGEYEKVKYVYETLVLETDYELNAPDSQNIYSVFVNHRSVCQGYAKATQYLLNRLGVECALVLGTVNGNEGHAWNLVRIDGSYYYVDTTWGDASYRTEDGAEDLEIQPDISYDYLNVTTAELLRTHRVGENVKVPLCTDNAANYYVREGAYFTEYDKEQAAALFQRMLDGGRQDVTLKCASEECYAEMLDGLIDRQEIFRYLPEAGNSVAYTRNDVQMSLTFWVTNR